MTRMLAVLLPIAALAACGGSSNPSFAATLSGSSEVPSNASTATGSATVTFNGATATYNVTYSGLSGAPTASHIHVAAAGASGAVVVPFSGLPATASGSFQGTFSQADIHPSTSPAIATMGDLETQARAGNLYVNIHTSGSPAGEIRGQLAPK